MNKGIVILLAGLMIATAIPAVAEEFEMTVDFQESGGGGNFDPEIVAKFEVSEGLFNDPNHLRTSGYDIDDDWSIEGTQVDPPMEFDGITWIGYYVFVFDEDGLSEIEHVNVHVWHPDDDDPYNPLGRDSWDKYNLVCAEIGITDELLDFVQAVHAVEAGGNYIICYGHEYNWETFWFHLINGHFRVFYTHKEIHYCQPAGYYLVRAHAQDIHGAYDQLYNYFEYVLGYGIETDFDSLDFGEARLNTWKWIYGDWVFMEDDGCPTIRSIGNWDTKVTIEFEDFDMGESDFGGETQWNVIFNTRLGDEFWTHANRSYIEKCMDLNPGWTEYACSLHPFTEYFVPSDWDPRGVNQVSPDIICDDYHAKCNTSKISFAILIRKPIGYDLYTGNMTLGVSMTDHDYEYLAGLPCVIED